MSATLQIDAIFEQFLAESDLRTTHRESGEHFSGPKSSLRRGFCKVLTPLTDLLEDSAAARQALIDFGYGTPEMPLELMVRDLLARLVEQNAPQEAQLADPVCTFDQSLGEPAADHGELLGILDAGPKLLDVIGPNKVPRTDTGDSTTLPITEITQDHDQQLPNHGAGRPTSSSRD